MNIPSERQQENRGRKRRQNHPGMKGIERLSCRYRAYSLAVKPKDGMTSPPEAHEGYVGVNFKNFNELERRMLNQLRSAGMLAVCTLGWAALHAFMCSNGPEILKAVEWRNQAPA